MGTWLKRITAILSVAALIVAMLLRIQDMHARPGLWYDEVYSILVAAGNSRYADFADREGYHPDAPQLSPPIDQWTSAGEWQALIRVQKGWNFGEIARDQAIYESNHPPMYPWAMNAWGSLTGSSTPTTFRILNLIFDLITASAILLIAYTCFDSWLAGLVGAALWALNPISMDAASQLRPYGLLAMLTALFALALAYALVRPSAYRLTHPLNSLISITAAGGILTHYYFVLPIISGVALAVVLYWKHDRTRVLGLMLWLAVGAVLTLVVHPSLPYAVLSADYADIAQYVNPPTRLETAWGSLSALVLLPALGLLLLGLVRLVRGSPAEIPHPGWMLIALAAGTVTFTFVLYLTGVSPLHSLWGLRYIANLWVLVVLATLSGITAIQEKIAANMVLLAVLVTGIAVVGVRSPDLLKRIARPSAGSFITAPLPPYPLLVMDNPVLGVALPTLIHLPEDAPVFVAAQEFLLAHPNAWLDRLAKSGGVFVHAPRFDTLREGDYQIRAMLEAAGALPHRVVTPDGWQADTVINVYLIEPAAILADAELSGRELGGILRLAGYRLDLNGQNISRIPANQRVAVILYWEALAVPGADYTAFVHVENAQGQIVAQDDVQPTRGVIPTSIWGPGAIYTSVHFLMLDLEQGEAPYRFLVGLYSWPDLARLPVTDGLQPAVPDGRIPLFTIGPDGRVVSLPAARE